MPTHLNALAFPADEGRLYTAVICPKDPALVNQLPTDSNPRLLGTELGCLLYMIQTEHHVSSEDVKVPGDD